MAFSVDDLDCAAPASFYADGLEKVDAIAGVLRGVNLADVAGQPAQLLNLSAYGAAPNIFGDAGDGLFWGRACCPVEWSRSEVVVFSVHISTCILYWSGQSRVWLVVQQRPGLGHGHPFGHLCAGTAPGAGR